MKNKQTATVDHTDINHPICIRTYIRSYILYRDNTYLSSQSTPVFVHEVGGKPTLLEVALPVFPGID